MEKVDKRTMSCKKCRNYDRECSWCKEFNIRISSTGNAKICSKYKEKNNIRRKSRSK